MRFLLAVTFFFLLSTAVYADEYVHGYYRSNGTYVQPYTRSSPDNTVTNNYSYEGNTNPYTGQVGTNRYEHDETSPYFTGPDSNGNIGHSGGMYGNESSDPND
jgi:hypothetical protein